MSQTNEWMRTSAECEIMHFLLCCIVNKAYTRSLVSLMWTTTTTTMATCNDNSTLHSARTQTYVYACASGPEAAQRFHFEFLPFVAVVAITIFFSFRVSCFFFSLFFRSFLNLYVITTSFSPVIVIVHSFCRCAPLTIVNHAAIMRFHYVFHMLQWLDHLTHTLSLSLRRSLDHIKYYILNGHLISTVVAQWIGSDWLLINTHTHTGIMCVVNSPM